MKRFGVTVAVAAAFGLAGCASHICGGSNVCMAMPKDDYNPSMAEACRSAQKKLISRAKAGDARAQYYLSVCYAGSAFGKADNVASMKWLLAAIDQDLMVAKAEFAFRSVYGSSGATRDPDAAREYFDRAYAQWLRTGGDITKPIDPNLRFLDIALRRWQKGEADFSDNDRSSLSHAVGSIGKMDNLEYKGRADGLAHICLAYRLDRYNGDIVQNLSIFGKTIKDCPAE